MNIDVNKLHTPCYVFDTNEAIRRVKEIQEKIPYADICFAMKANPYIVKEVSEVAKRIEVCSYGEFKICQYNQIDPKKLLFSGVVKVKEEIEEVLDYYGNVPHYTAESYNQYLILSDWAKQHNQILNVYLRLSDGSQFGMDEEDVKSIYKEENPWIHLCGLHYFTGTQKRNPDIYTKEFMYLDTFIQTLAYPVEELEYGIGTPVKYFTDTKERFSEDVYLHELKQAINNMHWQGKVTFEAGRLLAASSGHYFTKVIDTKKNKETNYVLVDGGIHHLHYDGQMRGMHIPYMQSYPKPTSDTPVVIAGSLCTTNDIIVSDAPLGNVEIGTVIEFKNAGAYSMYEGMTHFLSHHLPTIYRYDGSLQTIQTQKDTWSLHVQEKEGN